ncbi:serpin A9 [Rhynchocyon petersi]
MASFFHRVLILVGLCAPICCALLTSLTSREYACLPSTKSASAFHVSSINTDFAFRLYRTLTLKNSLDNIFFSPVSISTALAMLSLGAGSATKTQILEGLGFSIKKIPEFNIHQGFQQLVCSLNVSTKDVDLKMGSGLFIKKELQPQKKFLDTVQRWYVSKVFPTDFSNLSAAQKKINSYVEKETKGKIVDLIQGLDQQTVMVMVNYIFFKGKWEKPFDPAETSRASPFLVSKSTTVQVPMMHQVEQLEFGMDLELDCSVLRMNYSKDAQAFFILPGQGKMKQLEQALSASRLRKWGHLVQKRFVELFMPRFSISASYDLGTILPKMGIKDAFNHKADFSGITKKHSLMISKEL